PACQVAGSLRGVGSRLLIPHADISDTDLLRRLGDRPHRETDDPEHVLDALLLQALRHQRRAIDLAHVSLPSSGPDAGRRAGCVRSWLAETARSKGSRILPDVQMAAGPRRPCVPAPRARCPGLRNPPLSVRQFGLCDAGKPGTRGISAMPCAGWRGGCEAQPGSAGFRRKAGMAGCTMKEG